jgi:hypothetical protein
MDDILCERFGGCTGCGGKLLVRAVILTVGDLAVAASPCQRCDREDPAQVRIEALLAARYAPQPSP